MICGTYGYAQDAGQSSPPLAPAADPAVVFGYGVPMDDELVLARQRALRLAGAFANDSYKLRDGAWMFFLSPGSPRVLAVFLFAGNEMWFSAAGATAEQLPELALFDPGGNSVPTQGFQHDGMVAMGLTVPRTGLYYLQARTNREVTPFALVTSYK